MKGKKVVEVLTVIENCNSISTPKTRPGGRTPPLDRLDRYFRRSQIAITQFFLSVLTD